MEKVIFFILVAVAVAFTAAAEAGLYMIIWSTQSEVGQWIILVIMLTMPLLLAAPLCEMAEVIWPNLFE
jgi:hypothetical protein